jgi:ABC-type uncharacterized transport system substrate-binding protein
MFIARLLLIFLTFFSALVSAENIVLVAENNTPVLKKLIRELSQLTPDFSYQISTAKKPITIPQDAYVISVGAKQSSHVDYSQYPKRIAVMLTAKQAESSDMATSIYIEPPLSRQLQLADLLVPGDKKIGLLVSNKQDKEDVLKTLTDTEIMMLKVVNIEDYDNINQALFYVLKGTRLLLGHYNNDIYNAQNIKNILITSYRQRKVLIGPSRAYLKAGSFSTTFSDLSHIARRIMEVVIHHQGTGQWLKADYNPHYRILFNPQVARSLNIRMLESEVLMQKMGEK